MTGTLRVNEVYLSLQGESTFAGLPCVFVRLTGCNLRCSYCDTAYAFTEGFRQTHEEILAAVENLTPAYDRAPRVDGHRLPLIEFTGGEPLLQPGAAELMATLCDRGWTVLVETSGAIDLGDLDPRIRRIMDLKTPSSGESGRIHWPNLAHLKSTDEIKLVIGTQEDYAWVKTAISEHRLAERCPLLVSWVHPLHAGQTDPSLNPVPPDHTPITRQELVESIIADALPVRFQAQLHKVIWSPDQRGV